MIGQNEKRALLVVSCLASFLVPYTVSALNVALPAIGTDFGLDAVTLGWITSSYILTAAVFIIPFGRISDIYGRKKIFIVGNLLFAAGSLAAGIAWSGTSLIAARVIQGTGGSMVFATSVAILTAVFEPGERGRAIGIVTASVYAGLSFGPFIGGILIETVGWPSIFLVNVPICLLVLGLTLWKVPGEWCEPGDRRFDLPGAALYALMLVGLMYGLTLLPSWGGAVLIGLGVLLFIAFYTWEGREPRPIVDFKLFRNNRGFLYSNIAAMINYAVVFAVGFLLSLYLQYIRGVDPRTAGTLLIIQPILQTLISPLAGHVSDRVEPRAIATAGMALSTIGVGLLALLTPATPLAAVAGCLAVLGIGYGLFSSPNTNAIMSAVTTRHLGIASAMVSTMRAIGQMISLAIAMVVFSVVIGAVPITPDVYPGLLAAVTLTFTIFFFIGLAGIWASYTRGDLFSPER